METIITTRFLNIDTLPKEAVEIITPLLEEIKELKTENEVLKKSETHLKNAEEALTEKDAKFKILRECYSAIVRQRDRSYKELQKISEMLLEKDEEIDNLKKQLDTKITIIKGLEDTVKSQSQILDVLNKKVELHYDNAKKYRAALLDLEGTMCAQRDHSQDLAATIHRILN